MDPIFDRRGQIAGWLRGNVVHDRQSQPRAFIHEDAVFTYQGIYLGRLQRGYFRDQSGNAVAFMRGASGGPVPPIPTIPPVPIMPPSAPTAPIPPLAPVPTLPTFSWSSVSWDAFISNVREPTRDEGAGEVKA